jgi:hypothetical protein
MTNPIDFFNFLTGPQIIILFFKAFGFIFTVMYFVYSLVIYRQVQIMLRTINVNDSKRQSFILIMTGLQLLLGVILLILALIMIKT